MKKNTVRFIYSWILLLVFANAAMAQLTVTTVAVPPVNHQLNQLFSQVGGGVQGRLTYNIDSIIIDPNNPVVSVSCRVDRISPTPFSIYLNTDVSPGAQVTILPGQTRILSQGELQQAFGSLSDANLIFSGITPAEINGRWPEGVYQICLTARANRLLQSCCPQQCGSFPVDCSPFYVRTGCDNFTILPCTETANGILINTTVKSPVNPVIAQAISSNAVTSTLQFINPGGCDTHLKLFGRIESLSPAPFTIELNPQFISQQTITINAGTPVALNSQQLLDAFGGFAANNLVSTGISLASITDASNRIKLPDGNYRICFYARYFNVSDNVLGEIASNPNLGCSNFVINCAGANAVQINSVVKPQFNPVISQAISGGGVNTAVQINNQPLCNTQVKLYGKIERISPAPFSLSLNPDYQQQAPITLLTPVTQLTPVQQADAFGNFNDANLITTGIELAAIKDANNNIKLPDGSYRICFYARYLTANGTLAGNASDPNLGCATFTVCYRAGGAPQFTQPLSSLNINSDIAFVQAASPVVFTWTPPQSSCGLPAGGYTYDFEIRELFPNQSVTDAINNPFVFRKTMLPSTTFLLDTNLNKNVLHEGNRYAIRVRAVSANPNSPVEIENNGYSRIEAFQYGGSINGNIITQYRIPEPQDYFIPFKDRKNDFWDDTYSAYKRHTHGDTLIPVREYIAFALTQNQTAYSLDAIDLFLALNPELTEVKTVKMSYAPRLPEFPPVAVNDEQNFDKEHQANLEPDKYEENKFLKYLDTLTNYKQKVPETAGKMIHDLVIHLNEIKPQMNSVDRVSVELINKALSELLYELRRSSQGLNKTQYSQLQNLVSAVMDLTAVSQNSTSFLYLYPAKKTSSLSSYQSRTGEFAQKISLANDELKINDDNPEHLLSTILKQLLPFNVIVWRNSKELPSRPVLDAPDLANAYRIFYTLPDLYNHKNPEVNAKSTTHLASTVQVSLPSNTVFTFWALNMFNHKNTKPQDVDLKGVLSHTNKLLPEPKKPSIVLKVD